MNGPDNQDIIQWQESLRWLIRAAEDIRAARVLLLDDIVFHAAFHLQQAAEKILKALLIAARQDVRKTHDLAALANLVHRHWPKIIGAPFQLTYMSRWYITGRYPDDDDGPTDDEVKTALSEVEALFSSVIAQAPAALAKEAQAVLQSMS